MTPAIRAMTAEDWPAVRWVLQEGIRTGKATFETEAPEWEEWDASHIDAPLLIALLDGHLAGWAALSPVSKRLVYRGVAEVSVYVAEMDRGRGVGRELLLALIVASEKAGFWTLQSSVFEENIPSIELHHACGFRMVGIRERIARVNGI